MQLTRIFVELRIEMGIPFLCFSGYTTGVVVGGNGRVLTYIFKNIYQTSGWHSHMLEFIPHKIYGSSCQ